jgi:hypothetical protein
MVHRRDDGVSAGTVRDAQAGAEVVRIRDPVEDEHERRALDRVERVVDRGGALDRLDPRHDALVARRRRQAHQPRVVAVEDARARLAGALDELPHPRVAPRRVDVQLDHRLRRDLEADADGMETEQDVACHRRMMKAAVATRPISSGWCSM